MANTNSRKLPFGFFVCALTFSFERLAYYAAKWGMSIFIAAEVVKGGLGLDPSVAANMSANLVAFTYITPIIGGYVADRWVSPRLLVPIGELLMAVSYFCAWKANGLGMMWITIIVLAIGTGCFKGNVSGINGRLFPADDEALLNEVFNIQYMFVNIGSFCGTSFLSLLAGVKGYRFMFFICGCFMILDFLWWMFGMRYFGDAGKLPFKKDNRNAVAETEAAAADDAPLTHLEKNRVIAICIVTVFSGIFWLIWYMVYMPVYFKFGPVSEAGLGWANWTIGSFTMPTAWFDSTNALLCIILCPIFAKFWLYMASRPKGDWGMFTKTAIGIIILGISTGMMVLAAILSNQSADTATGIWIILLVALFMTVGEVIFSPLGNAFISKYAPKKLLGTLLGVWPLIIFFSGKLYGPLYNWLDKFDFIKAYSGVTIIIVGIGVLMLLFTKKFNKMIDGE